MTISGSVVTRSHGSAMVGDQKGKVILFEHVPKCGGSTLETLLRNRFPRERVFECRTDSRYEIEDFRKLSIEERNGFDLITGHGSLALKPFISRRCRCITLLRHPVDRFVSNFYHVRRAPGHKDFDLVNQLSLSEFILHPVGATYSAKLVGRFSGFDVEGIRQDPDAALECAMANLRRFEVVGITELFDLTVLMMWLRFGWRGFPFYVRKNVGHNPGSKSLTSQDRGLLEDRCKLDLALYLWAKGRLLACADHDVPEWRRETFRWANRWYGKAISARRRMGRFRRSMLRESR